METKTLEDKLWYIISGDFCYSKHVPKKCPKDDDGSVVSCEWCETQKVLAMLAKEQYGKMVDCDKTSVKCEIDSCSHCGTNEKVF